MQAAVLVRSRRRWRGQLHRADALPPVQRSLLSLEVSLASVYRRAEGVATKTLAGETLAVPFKGTLASLHQVFALNPVADFVWRRIDGQAPLDAILDAVLQSFDVEREQALADLRELIVALRDAGLVHEVAAAPGNAPGA